MKFIEHLAEAQKIISIIDHMYYVTFPLVKDKRMLLRILAESKKATAHCINAILQCEYILTRIQLYKDPEINFRIFELKCAPLYDISQEEIKLIRELFEITETHKKSPAEFRKGETIIIFGDNAKTTTITEEKIKQFLLLSKSVCQKATERIRAKYKNP